MMSGERRNEDLERRAEQSILRSGRKFIFLLLAVGLILLCLHFTPAKHLLLDIERLKSQFRGLGLWAPLVFFLASTLLTMLGFPRLGLTFAAGVLFGSKLGMALALGSTLLGSYASFCVARWCGAEWAERIAGRHRKLEFAMSNQTVGTVFLIRQLPITNIILNLLLSLTRVGHGTFLAGSLLGFLPAALVAVLSGSSIGKTSSSISFFQFSLAVLIVLVSVATVISIKRKWKADNAT